MIKSDINEFLLELKKQGWNKSLKQFQDYYDEQQKCKRKVFVAEIDGNAAGYANLIFNDVYGSFKGK